MLINMSLNRWTDMIGRIDRGMAFIKLILSRKIIVKDVEDACCARPTKISWTNKIYHSLLQSL